MRVLVVSRVPSLAAAIGSRLDAIGIEPEDLPVVLRDSSELGGAVVECATMDMTIRAAETIREHDPWTPLVLLLSGDTLPDRSATDSLEPVRLVRRPFTTAQVVDHLVSMQSTMRRPVEPTSVGTDVEAAPEPTPRHVLDVDDDATTRRMRDGWRSRRARQNEPAVQNPRDAIHLLNEADLPPSVPDAAHQIVRAVTSLVTDTTAVAVLVLDGNRWTVEAGRGVRPNESRIVVEPSHWLASHVAGRDTAVVVSGTDVARQELHGVPLIHFENWMAATMAGSRVMVVLGREDDPVFEAGDAIELTDGTRALVGQLIDAVDVRRLARRLAPYA